MSNNVRIDSKGNTDFDYKLLRDTSRSFYLTLRVLPKSIRWPISLAYLLARGTDTIADVMNLSAEERLMLLIKMNKKINTGSFSEKIFSNQFFSGLNVDAPEFKL